MVTQAFAISIIRTILCTYTLYEHAVLHRTTSFVLFDTVDILKRDQQGFLSFVNDRSTLNMF